MRELQGLVRPKRLKNVLDDKWAVGLDPGRRAQVNLGTLML